MNEDFVTYEQAVTLKKCGFDWSCNNYYIEKVLDSEHEEWDEEECMYCTVWDVERYPKPRLDQVAKWLREAKGLFIEIWLHAVGYSWIIEKCDNLNCNGTVVDSHNKDSGFFTTYESALSAGIDAALNKISNN